MKAPASSTADPVAVARPHDTAERRVRVLYIEDDHDNLELVRALLAPHRFDLETASRGAAGLQTARTWQPDVILLDLGLPDMSGVDVLAALRADAATRRVPVMVITADAAARASPRVLAANVEACLVKPIDVAGFVACVERMISRNH